MQDELKQTELLELIDSLEQIYGGEPWHGEGFLEKLNKLDWTIVSQAPTQNPTTIARLVKHIINWRVFLIEKIKGNSEFDIKNDAPNDWTDIVIESKEAWTDLLTEMAETQNEIIRLLKEKTDAFLDQQVSGRSYNFKFLIRGIIHHDIYHIGQVGLVASQLKAAS